MRELILASLLALAAIAPSAAAAQERPSNLEQPQRDVSGEEPHGDTKAKPPGEKCQLVVSYLSTFPENPQLAIEPSTCGEFADLALSTALTEFIKRSVVIPR